MKSPFPGMDPFIEAFGLWEDFHDDLIAEIKRVLAQQLPRGYLVRTRKRAYVILAEAEEKTQRPFIPDGSVTSPRRGKPAAAKERGVAPTASPAEGEPLSLRAFIDREFEEKFIDVYELKPE